VFIDARELANDTLVESDICIVGGGVAGITIAREFIGLPVDVCVLESGGFAAEPDTQDLAVGSNVGHPYYPLETARLRQFGGSSPRWRLDLGDGRYGGRLRPLGEIDFEKRDWVPYSGWPFTRAQLLPYYERAQAVCNAGPFAYDLSDWQSLDHEQALPLRSRRVQTAIYQAVRSDVFAKEHRVEVGQASNLRVYLHANVLELETTESATSVTAVRVGCLNGVRFSVKSRIFLLALGGIETPRLLLLSNRHQPAGLGNQNDLVGRFFMEHPHLWSGFYLPSNAELFKKAGMYRAHTVKGAHVLGQLMLSEETIRREQILNYSLFLQPGVKSSGQRAVSKGRAAVKAAVSALARGDVAELNRHLSTLFPVAGDLAFAVHAKAMRILNRLLKLRKPVVFLLNHMTEQAPNPDSRVTLSKERDAFGQSRIQLDWRLSGLDIHSIRRAQEIIDEELRAAGLGRLEIELDDDTPPPHLHGGWHHMGTTRMHADPRQGVVDADCKLHGVSNLYIAGPSVFPTGGCANPVLTIVALALRLADHLKRQVLPETEWVETRVIDARKRTTQR
jgi:choline dehydrogenase-like flavoprotein